MGSFEVVLPDGIVEHRGLVTAKDINDENHGEIKVDCWSPLHHQLTSFIAAFGWPHKVDIRPREGEEHMMPDGPLTIEEPEIIIEHFEGCRHDRDIMDEREQDFVGAPESRDLAMLEDRRARQGGLSPHAVDTIHPVAYEDLDTGGSSLLGPFLAGLALGVALGLLIGWFV